MRMRDRRLGRSEQSVDAGGRGRVRRPLVGTAVAMGAALAIAACGGGSTVNTGSTSANSGGSGTSSASTTTAAAGGKGAWVLGSLIDLTGVDAAGGAAQQKGMQYLLNEINGAGGINGHHITVKYCDTTSTPSGAAQCAQQLAGVNTHIVLGQTIDPTMRAALPYLTHNLVVAVDPILVPKASTNVFQATGAPGALLAVFAKAVKAAGMHTIGVLYTTDTSGTHQLAAAQGAAKAVGLKVVSQPQTPGVNDVTPQLAKLRSEGADVIFLASVGTNTTAAVNSYRTLSMSQPAVVGAGAVTDGFLHSLSSIPSHLYGDSQLLVTTTGLPSATVTAFQHYLTAFKAQEHEPADTQTTSGVYAGCVATDALKAAGPSVSAMAKYLKTSPVSCLGSTMHFNIPGLNVVNGQPSALAEAPRNANDGWQPVSGKF